MRVRATLLIFIFMSLILFGFQSSILNYYMILIIYSLFCIGIGIGIHTRVYRIKSFAQQQRPIRTHFLFILIYSSFGCIPVAPDPSPNGSLLPCGHLHIVCFFPFVV